MGKTAFLFPGQGAQYPGMGKDFYEEMPAAREVFEEASRVTGLDIPSLCFEENEKLNITEYTQIAMLSVEAAILAVLQEAGCEAEIHAGLSLGEYGALLASKVMSREEVFRVVRKRGIYMQEAVPEGGAMAAVLGLDSEKIAELCQKADGMVTVANYNCPGQTVITGESNAVEAITPVLKEAGAKRVVPLNVSGPFHSPMLKGAGEKLYQELSDVTIHDVQTPYITNVTADYVKDKKEVKELLSRQVSSSVRWQETIERMIRDGVDTFVEIGPGKTLTGFLKKIDRSVTGINIQTVEDLKQYLENRRNVC